MSENTAILKKQIEEKREQAKTLDDVLKLVDEIDGVIKKEHDDNNYVGVVDALGHKRLIFAKAEMLTDDAEVKSDYKTKQYEVAEQTVDIAKKQGTSNLPIAVTHFCGVVIDQESSSSNPDTTRLEQALNEVRNAMKLLPGSKAHLAWPGLSKARLETLLGRYDDSMNTLLDGFRNLNEGYEDEMANDNNAKLKLKVWLSGLQLGMAELCIKQNKPVLARMWADAVIKAEDPEGHLTTRKQQANKLLGSLKQ